MRAFLIVSAMFIAVAAAVTFYAPDSPYIREIWGTIAVGIVFAAAWTFIGRRKE